ncbi:MAG: type I methionyl aminopeptidase [Sandaracinaceae bacterium]|jgi:methionyl aminopeptidase|nr:type I methionyl aminopeptidase [Sandaracinaceae bacterium]MBP7680674.1 type I methionyl aminopeptidase [Deltaproteobacteria bacterium]MBK6808075.1 type I methionyl aminopeptidase [Sandaracinaceae bacterium]MBK7150975.1 type I methionyl aminopeptidase [Sandaracinaceae bacterium]MBK7773098.1 type I methionyl aminopeptidase [Sandaracinaceae bacterium]
MHGRISILSPKHQDAMRRAGRVAAETLAVAARAVAPGVTTAAIDALVAADTKARRGRCAQYHYRQGRLVFPAHVCTSVNEVVCHGIPGPQVLREGDIVNVDVTTELHGWHGDTSRTIAVGAVSPEAAHVTAVAARALEVGIAQVRPGAHLHEVGAAIEEYARTEGCSVVRDFGGHGIGRSMHMAPHVPHHRCSTPGPRLVPGMCFTIEPMLCLGAPQVRVLPDGWTVVTADGALSAQAEHTILVTESGVEVLTLAPES